LPVLSGPQVNKIDTKTGARDSKYNKWIT